MSGSKRPRFGPGPVIALILLGVLAMIVLTGSYRPMLRWLYSPFAAALAAVAVIEYLVLKGSDRSAIYRRERDAARALRRDDMIALRRMEALSSDLSQRLERIAPDAAEAQALRDELRHAKGVIDSLLKTLRARNLIRRFAQSPAEKGNP